MHCPAPSSSPRLLSSLGHLPQITTFLFPLPLLPLPAFKLTKALAAPFHWPPCLSPSPLPCLPVPIVSSEPNSHHQSAAGVPMGTGMCCSPATLYLLSLIPLLALLIFRLPWGEQSPHLTSRPEGFLHFQIENEALVQGWSTCLVCARSWFHPCTARRKSSPRVLFVQYS